MKQAAQTARKLRATHVTLAHGGGGKAMRDLIEDVFTSRFKPDGAEELGRCLISLASNCESECHNH